MSEHRRTRFPEIRFPAFSGGWTRSKLSDHVTKIGSGVTPKGGSSVYVDEGVSLIRSQNVKGDRLDLSDVVFITREIHESMSGSGV